MQSSGSTSKQLRSKLETSLLGLYKSRPSALYELKSAAFARFEATGLPGHKVEEFRFSTVGALDDESLVVVADAEPSIASPIDVSAVQLVVVNGIPKVIGELPRGVRVLRLSEMGVAESDLLSTVGSLVSDQDGWVAANTAGFIDGFVIVVASGIRVSVPIELVFVQASHDSAVVALPRAVVSLGENSRLELIERHLSCGQAVSLSNGVVECFVGNGAELVHSRWVALERNAHELTATGVAIGSDAIYQSWSLSSSGRFVRHDLRVRLQGTRAKAVLDGLYYANPESFVDNHVHVWHEQAEGTTKECYRGVIENQGRGVFDGVINVCKGAVKTDARQENKNLLLGPLAVVNTKPHLEIDADDVSCSHGATVGQLDESQLFYLQARGIDAVLGRKLLTWAFAKEIVERCPNESVRRVVSSRLEGDLAERHDEEVVSC